MLKTSDDYFVRKARYIKWIYRIIGFSIDIIFIIINIIVTS